MRVQACLIFTVARRSMTGSALAETRLCMTVVHSLHKARMVPPSAFAGMYSTSPKAGSRGHRHLKQKH